MITFILAVCGNVDYVYSFPQSPPSRAAWIEIYYIQQEEERKKSRRLHGRRGLKFHFFAARHRAAESPPSRAAWIEMCNKGCFCFILRVAAFTGGVD